MKEWVDARRQRLDAMSVSGTQDENIEGKRGNEASEKVMDVDGLEILREDGGTHLWGSLWATVGLKNKTAMNTNHMTMSGSCAVGGQENEQQ